MWTETVSTSVFIFSAAGSAIKGHAHDTVFQPPQGDAMFPDSASSFSPIAPRAMASTGKLIGDDGDGGPDLTRLPTPELVTTFLLHNIIFHSVASNRLFPFLCEFHTRRPARRQTPLA
jgi:hypothetical protein